MSNLDKNISPEEKSNMRKEYLRNYYHSMKNKPGFKENKSSYNANYYKKRSLTDKEFKERLKNTATKNYQKKKR